MSDQTGAVSAPVHLVPGIIYSPLERRARIAGTGLEVWEIIRGYRAVDQNWERLQAAYDWLSEEQLRAVLACAEANPAFVNARLQEEEDLERNIEQVWCDYPAMRPPYLFDYLPHPPDDPEQ